MKFAVAGVSALMLAAAPLAADPAATVPAGAVSVAAQQDGATLSLSQEVAGATIFGVGAGTVATVGVTVLVAGLMIAAVSGGSDSTPSTPSTTGTR